MEQETLVHIEEREKSRQNEEKGDQEGEWMILVFAGQSPYLSQRNRKKVISAFGQSLKKRS